MKSIEELRPDMEYSISTYSDFYSAVSRSTAKESYKRALAAFKRKKEEQKKKDHNKNSEREKQRARIRILAAM